MVDFSEYQKRAGETDETGNQFVALFGAVSEVGSILAVYKKKEREGLQDEQFRVQLGEEIGDTLWYLANLARLSGLDLNSIAEENLEKARSLFDPGDDIFFDGEFPPEERLPRSARGKPPHPPPASWRRPRPFGER